jgi:hypothetical protein
MNKKSPYPNDKISSNVSSIANMGKNVTKSMKHIKINPISTSFEIPKLKKTISSTKAASKENKSFKF